MLLNSASAPRYRPNIISCSDSEPEVPGKEKPKKGKNAELLLLETEELKSSSLLFSLMQFTAAADGCS